MKLAQKLMEKHNVEMAEVLQSQQRSAKFNVIRQCCHSTSKVDRWMRSMISTVQLITDANCYISTKRVPAETKRGWTEVFEVWFYGDEVDVAAACSLYKEFLVVFRTMARHHLGAKWTQQHYHYMEGFGHGMVTKLYEDRQEAARNRTATTTGLIVSKQQAITKYAEEELRLTVKKSKTIRKSSSNYDAYGKGFSDGKAYGTGPSAKLT